MQSGHPLSRPGSPQVTPISPLFPPTTLISGDSITRNIHFFNAITRRLPSATVPVIRNELLNLLDSLPTSVKIIIVHVGTNNTTRRESERTKNYFNLLFDVLKPVRYNPPQKTNRVPRDVTYIKKLPH